MEMTMGRAHRKKPNEKRMRIERDTDGLVDAKQPTTRFGRGK